MIIKKIKNCLKTEIKNYYKIIKILCTSKEKLFEEEKKLKKYKKDCVHKLLLGYYNNIKKTHEYYEIKEQLKCKRKFYEQYCDIYIKNPITRYIEGTNEFNIINILNDINDGKIKIINIIFRIWLEITTAIIIAFIVYKLN